MNALSLMKPEDSSILKILWKTPQTCLSLWKSSGEGSSERTRPHICAYHTCIWLRVPLENNGLPSLPPEESCRVLITDKSCPSFVLSKIPEIGIITCL